MVHTFVSLLFVLAAGCMFLLYGLNPAIYPLGLLCAVLTLAGAIGHEAMNDNRK